MSVAHYLIDTSALARVLLSQSDPAWDAALEAGVVALCDLTELEFLYSARSTGDRERLEEWLGRFEWCPVPEGVHRRARVVQRQLTAKGEHRSAGPVDLLVAATAEEAGLILLHHDRDFEVIARTTGQPVHMIGLR
ncbi:PIN domain nuclease [Streptomyces sp. TR06-5]|uniref:PIN domain nuclease n=1 Tax=Streptomyces sp. TR06-5 TaxID=3385976 RepID=UPI00399FDF11